MKRCFTFTVCSMLLLSVVGEMRSRATQAPRYAIVSLSAGNFRSSVATKVNSRGQAVGRLVLPNGENRAFVHVNGARLELDTLGGAGSIAYGINDAGVVVGVSYIANNRAEQAFSFNGVTLTNLGTLGGLRSVARAINRNNVIVGQSDTTTGARANPHAFLYENGALRDLGTLGGTSSTATDVNNRGQVVGYAETPSGNYHAFLFSNGVMIDLGSLNNNSSLAWNINDLGVIVGVSDNQAFVYENGVMRGLGGLPEHRESTALGVNNAGHVVGFAFNHDNHRSRAFVYRDGVMLDLNDLIPSSQQWELTQATSINDAGQIVGHGYFNRQQQAFLLTPIRP